MPRPDAPSGPVPDEGGGAPTLKAWLGWGFRLALTGLLLWLALRKVPLQGIRAALGRVHPGAASASVGLFLAGCLLVEPARLAFAAHLLEERQPGYPGWVRIFMESRPFYYLLPGALASEGVVWIRLRQLEWHHQSCGFVVLATRVWGVAIWGLAAAFALARPDGAAAILAQAPAWLGAPHLWAMGGVGAAVAAFAAPVLMARFRNLPVRPHITLTNVAMALGSAVSAALVTASVVLASRASGTPLSFTQSLGLMALFNFAMVLPLSLGGFGLQEGMILLMGTALGFEAPALIAFSAVLHAQRLTLSLAGLGVFLAGRGPVRRSSGGSSAALCSL